MTPHALCFGRGLPPEGAACAVNAGADGLDIGFSDGTVQHLPYHSVEVAGGGFDREHLVIIARETDRRLYVTDGAVWADLRRQAPPALARAVDAVVGGHARHRRTTTMVLIVSLLFIVTAVVGFWLVRDVLVAAVVDRIPLEWEAHIGEVTHQQVTAGRRLVESGPAVAAVHEITARLLEPLGDQPYEFRTTLVVDETVNALAAPGGRLIVFTGLLQQAESPDELAGVLAHEISHVRLRHGLQGLVESAGMTAIVMWLFGAQSGLGGTLQRLGVDVITLRYSRDKETEADLEGLMLLSQAGINPQGLVRFFERLAAQDHPGLLLLSSHPMSVDRAQRLARETQAWNARPSRPWSFDWRVVKGTILSGSPTAMRQEVTTGFDRDGG